MKIVRFRDVSGRTVQAAQQPDGTWRRVEGNVTGGFRLTGEAVAPTKWLAPIEPSCIWCVGQNYRAHAAEAGFQVPEHPVIFAKGVNSLQNPGEPIVLPASSYSAEVDYECELRSEERRVGKGCRYRWAADH